MARRMSLFERGGWGGAGGRAQFLKVDAFGGSFVGRKRRRFACRAPAGSGAGWVAVDGRSDPEIGVSVLGIAVAGSGRSGRESGVFARQALAAR